MNEEKKHKIKMKIVTGINLLAALLFTFLIFKSEITTYIFKTHTMIYATIKSVDVDSNDDGGYNYDYLYSYTVNGKEYEKEVYESPLKYKLGEKAKICYKNNDPNDSVLYDGRISRIFFVLIYGGLSIYLFLHSSELKEKHTIIIDGEVVSGSDNSKEAMIKRMEEAKARKNMNNK